MSKISKSQALILAALFLATGVAVAILNWNQPVNQDTNRKFNQAIAFDEFDQAETLIRPLFARNANDPKAFYFQACLELARDQPDAAMSAMRKALETGYPQESILALRAVLLARAGQFQEALPPLEKALATSAIPESLAYEGLSRIYLSTMQLSLASKAIDAWMKASPMDDRPYLWKNEIAERVGSDLDEIVLNYREAIKRNPTNFKAAIALAQLLLKTNRMEEAEVEFQLCLKQKPDDADVLLGLGQVALHKADTDAAGLYFKKVLESKPDEITALTELAQIEIQKGEIQSACNRLKKASELMPYESEIHYKYAQALKLAGQPELAKLVSAQAAQLRADQDKIQEMRKALVQQPDNYDLRFEASRWLLTHGHEKEGLEWGELILKQKPGHVPTCQLLAEYFEKKQDFGLANYYKSLIQKPK